MDAVDAQMAVDRLVTAALTGSRADWDTGVAAVDPTSATRLSLLFDNLRAVAPARLRLRLTGVEQELPAARRAVLGPDARAVQARLDWRLPGERADATSTVWLTLVPGTTGPRLAGTDDGPQGGTDGGSDAGAEPDPVPLLWLAPTVRATRGDVTVLAGTGQDATRWLDLAVRAAADARTHLPEPLRGRWDGHLVVEVPGSGADLARVLGAAPTTYATTAAVTRPEGPTTDAAVRVVVNPATAAQPDDALGATLVHETVHVATRSAASPAPLWAVEGLAEHVALAAHPGQRGADLAALRTGGAPTALPDDAAFATGGADVGAAYAQAWLLCETVVDRRGEDDLGRFYAALDTGSPVDDAARSALGVDESTLVGWWRDALRRATADGGG
ncbi:hypothetical protein GCM10022197_17170 [Microlunatus spumicola]|uniref:DUF4157 domain-containing protein n=1 Tax=Microlunatus spumicola TaxID=81499 RepID=A0ABP6X8A4_9ACTN